MKKLIVVIILFFIVSAIFTRVIRKMILPEIVGNIKGQELVSEENLYYGDINEGCEYEFGDGENPNHFHEQMEFDRSGDLIEVREENFLDHMSDIYLNGSEYMGKTITYEGMFFSNHDEESGKTYKYVLRYGPGCCADHGVIGLEIFTENTYDEKEWVRVSGTLTDYQGPEYKHLVLDNVEIEVLETRGKETVTH